jgi:membrane protease YdiL (CAAX protease family)
MALSEADPPADTADTARSTVPPRVLRGEVVAVFAVSLGASGVVALLSFVQAVTAPGRLADQRASIVTPFAPGRPWLDLIYQLVTAALALAPVGLVIHLLHRGGERLRDIGVDRSRPGRDVAAGAGMAAIIGGAGLGLYLLAHAIGVNRAVVPAELPAAWWRIPVEIIVAAQNGILEEILVLGYLLHRLDQLGWSRNRAVAASAVLRGSYHLYQGLGGFAGNVIMGVIFAKLYQRFGRVGPLIVAHTLIDSVALVGYTLLVGHVSWLPHGG